MRTLLRATAALAPIFFIAVAACSDDKNTQKDSGPGHQVCPTTIIEATASPATEGTSGKCHVDAYICVVGYQCGNFTQQATCTCDGVAGKFSCVTANGAAVPDQTTDPTTLCLTTQPDAGSDPCPTDKTKGTGTPCKNAGQQCYYATTCTGNPPPTDVCQCKGNAAGDAGLSWVCELNNCP